LIICKACKQEITDTKYSVVEDIEFVNGFPELKDKVFICDRCAQGMTAENVNDLLRA